jgi:putative MATE family efflux protein
MAEEINPPEDQKSPPISRPGHKAGPVFLSGDIPRHLRRMSIPMGWGILAMIASALVDAYFLGRLGTVYLAAITFTFPVVSLLTSLTLGLGSGVSSILARSIGETDIAKVRQQALCAIALSVALVGIMSAIGYFTIDPLFTLLGAGPETLPLIRDFMVIYYLSMVFLVVSMTGNFIMRASGDARSAGAIMTTTAVLTIALDPILIFGLFGLPRLEMQGAALAGAIARMITFCATFYILVFRQKLVSLIFPPIASLLRIWREIFRIGGPLAAANMVGPVSMAVITALLASFGEATVAGFGVAARIEALALIPLFAVSSGMSPIVGQNYGAGQIERVFEAIKASGRFCLYYGIAAGLCLLAFHRILPGFFDSDPEVIQSAAWYLLMTPFGFTAIGISISIGAAYNGMGDPKPSVIMTIFRTFVLFLPFAFLGAHLIGPLGVYMAGAFANLAVGVGAWVWVMRRHRLWLHRQGLANKPGV